NAVLNGGTVQVQAAPGNYTAGTQYTFLTASSVTGVFSGVITDLAFFNPLLGYTNNSAYFTLVPSGTAYAVIARTRQEFAVGTYLDILSPTASGDLQTVLDGINLLTEDQARAAFNQLSGELYGTLSQVGIQ